MASAPAIPSLRLAVGLLALLHVNLVQTMPVSSASDQNVNDRLLSVEVDIDDLKKSIIEVQAQAESQASTLRTLGDQIKVEEDNIAQVNLTCTDQYETLQGVVDELIENVTILESHIVNVATNHLNQVVSGRINSMTIEDLKVQVHLIADRLTRLSDAAKVTIPPPPTPSTTTTTTETTTKFPVAPTLKPEVIG